MEKKYKLVALDTCYPDYFRGHHKPVMVISAWNGMTAEEFITGVVDEYNMIWDHLTMEGYDYDDKAEKAWPDFTDEQITALARDMLTDPDTDNVFPELPEAPEDGDEDGWLEHEIYCHIVWEVV